MPANTQKPAVKADSGDLKKVKAAAASRSKSAKKWSPRTQYIIWIGGTVVMILAACIVLIVNPDRGPFEIPVNDINLITHVNRNSKTWMAGQSLAFEGWFIGDVKTLDGISTSAMAGAVQTCQVPEVETPENFDAREKWPQCFNNPIYSMGNCTASWAITAASALSNRFCIADPDQYSWLSLSPQQLISCDKSNRACEGGDIDTVWNYIEQEGLVSELCFPYQADGTVACASKTKCSPAETPLKGSSHCVLNNEAMIKREVMTHGPVVAPLFLMDDFLVYKSGIYKEMPTATTLTAANRQKLLHAVKIIGWGKSEGKSYWTIENSFGKDWGEEGFGKVHMGGEEGKREGIIIESYVLSGTPANKKVEDAGEDDEFEADADLDSDEEKADDLEDLDDGA